ncbi:MAG: type III-B CRISPR module-associated protein Cmr5 [Fibromonadales bacterium]|nr:type III-B CRISPR module-associated protein Cmr5 [Fibromonadales bacterium]
MQNEEQKRASFALNKISSLNKITSEIANFFVGLPTMLLTNGLGQTLAFLLSKKGKKEECKIAFDVIREYLNGDKDEMNFLKGFNSMPQKKYLEMQKEALAVANWLKRYARAFEEKGT